jgi:hydrogenase maturation protease
MNREMVEAVANAVLYEGYVLYPYRASAVKNRQRWNFGVLYPPACEDNASRMQVECLARGGVLSARIRFLQLMARDTLDSTGVTVDSWQEAMEREVNVTLASLHTPHRQEFDFPAAVEPESHRIVRRREAIRGALEISAEEVGRGWFRLRLSIENATFFVGADRESALLRSFVSTHAILSLGEGEFASLLDPPEDLREAAADCRNFGAYPVLAGEPGCRDAMLCSPIILYDYPAIAPESAGALFDGTEIDEILSLRILTLTGEEKKEMHDLDEFSRRILERTEALTPEQFMQMHGTLRHPAGGKP